MKKIRYMRQRSESDCGVACVAMVAGVTHRQAFEMFGFHNGEEVFYTRHSQLIDALEKLGCVVQRKVFRSWRKIPGCAIVPVNHRKNRKYFHWVVFDGEAILDPNPDRPERQRNFRRYRAKGWYLLLIG